ncbi:MAG: hypothetical protein IPG34_01365 [Rhodocyclaceae bacterium]|nr:hypothetical protein [Rhodocyclaceae bacterium]
MKSIKAKLISVAAVLAFGAHATAALAQAPCPYTGEQHPSRTRGGWRTGHSWREKSGKKPGQQCLQASHQKRTDTSEQAAEAAKAQASAKSSVISAKTRPDGFSQHHQD